MTARAVWNMWKEAASSPHIQNSNQENMKNPQAKKFALLSSGAAWCPWEMVGGLLGKGVAGGYKPPCGQWVL